MLNHLLCELRPWFSISDFVYVLFCKVLISSSGRSVAIFWFARFFLRKSPYTDLATQINTKWKSVKLSSGNLIVSVSWGNVLSWGFISFIRVEDAHLNWCHRRAYCSLWWISFSMNGANCLSCQILLALVLPVWIVSLDQYSARST